MQACQYGIGVFNRLIDLFCSCLFISSIFKKFFTKKYKYLFILGLHVFCINLPQIAFEYEKGFQKD